MSKYTFQQGQFNQFNNDDDHSFDWDDDESYKPKAKAPKVKKFKESKAQ